MRFKLCEDGLHMCLSYPMQEGGTDAWERVFTVLNFISNAWFFFTVCEEMCYYFANTCCNLCRSSHHLVHKHTRTGNFFFVVVAVVVVVDGK